MKIGIVLFLVCMICIPMATAKVVSKDPVPVGPGEIMGGDGKAIAQDTKNPADQTGGSNTAGQGTSRSKGAKPVILGKGLPGIAITTPDPDEAAEINAVDATAALVSSSNTLTRPLLVNPGNLTKFSHYPRTTTLTWRPVTGANAYLVEKQYGTSIDGGTWWSMPTDTVTTQDGTYLTFDFVGSQPGRWRVSAIDTTGTYKPSPNSSWKYFNYTLQMGKLSTPLQVSPKDNVFFYHYPRATTLAWRPVLGAVGYSVETQYYSGSAWTNYPDGTATVSTKASHTFNFVGAQPGRWRVTALAGSDVPYYNSNPSGWFLFTYNI